MRNLPEKSETNYPWRGLFLYLFEIRKAVSLTSIQIPSCLVDGQPYPHHSHFPAPLKNLQGGTEGKMYTEFIQQDEKLGRYD